MQSVPPPHIVTDGGIFTFLRQQLAFLVLDTNGQWWLIGHQEDPYPVIKCTHQTGEPDGEKAGNVYEVTLIGRKTLISVSV